MIIVLNLKNTITAHIGILKEKKIKRQPTIQTIIDASETKNYLVDAFVTADIPLEKIDKLQNW